MKKILLVNKNISAYNNLQNNLSAQGYTCITANSETVCELLSEKQTELVVLYSKEQKADLELLARMKKINPSILVIVIGKMNCVEEKIKWLENGVCDCVDIDCSLGEMLARIHALSRRTHSSRNTCKDWVYCV